MHELEDTHACTLTPPHPPHTLPRPQVGAYLAWPVRILMFITGIITWPISKVLDWILGEESALFRWARAQGCCICVCGGGDAGLDSRVAFP